MFEIYDGPAADWKAPIYHIRPIRREHGLEFSAGADVVKYPDEDIDLSPFQGFFDWFSTEIIPYVPNKYSSHSVTYELGNDLLVWAYSHVIDERVHLKVYRKPGETQ